MTENPKESEKLYSKGVDQIESTFNIEIQTEEND